MTMANIDTAFLLLRAPALLPENQSERDRLLGEIAGQLGVDSGEVDLTTITNTAAEGTATAARFPVSQDALSEFARGPLWDSRVADLFLAPDPS
jgi:hypothetical protein